MSWCAGGPFFLGRDLSLVDITFVPMLERVVASLLYYKGCVVRGQGRWPAVERWFEALEARSTYMGTKSGTRQPHGCGILMTSCFCPAFGKIRCWFGVNQAHKRQAANDRTFLDAGAANP